MNYDIINYDIIKFYIKLITFLDMFLFLFFIFIVCKSLSLFSEIYNSMKIFFKNVYKLYSFSGMFSCKGLKKCQK